MSSTETLRRLPGHFFVAMRAGQHRVAIATMALEALGDDTPENLHSLHHAEAKQTCDHLFAAALTEAQP